MGKIFLSPTKAAKQCTSSKRLISWFLIFGGQIRFGKIQTINALNIVFDRFWSFWDRFPHSIGTAQESCKEPTNQIPRWIVQCKQVLLVRFYNQCPFHISYPCPRLVEGDTHASSPVMKAPVFTAFTLRWVKWSSTATKLGRCRGFCMCGRVANLVLHVWSVVCLGTCV